MVQDSPRPRKTLTQLLPVTLPMELSACSSCRAAVLDANVSGKLVPKATSVIAVMLSSMPTVQPSRLAMSLMAAVTTPIMKRAAQKVAHPPNITGGGTSRKMTFQKSAMLWEIQSVIVASDCSSALPPQYKASTAFSRHRARVLWCLPLGMEPARYVRLLLGRMTSHIAPSPSPSANASKSTPSLGLLRSTRNRRSPGCAIVDNTGMVRVCSCWPSSKCSVPSVAV
mmetsp:Transcript_34902/g.99636  ORF Transcript_34902/g.99636 Transcript_34902/m.99636 type:complete len:226 (+) Transcript_34902:360-1037(+)